MSLLKFTLAGLRTMLVLTFILGLLYPLAVLGVSQVAMPGQANGSFVEVDGKKIGSRLIGQQWDGPQWLHSRPSAADYDAMASSGSNDGPNEPRLVEAIQRRRETVAREEAVRPQDVPADALTASSSGLDPHISPAYAELQVARIARVRHLSEAEVRSIIAAATTNRWLSVLGDPVVNVLEVNVALSRR